MEQFVNIKSELKEFEKYLDQTEAMIKARLDKEVFEKDPELKKLQGEKVTISKVTKILKYTAENLNEVEKEYVSPQLDQGKIKAFVKDTGVTPKGLTPIETSYLMFKQTK